MNSKSSKSVANQKPGYKPKTDLEKLRRLYISDINRISYDRWGHEFPDDEAGRGDLDVLLHYVALHPTHGRQKMMNVIETRASWMHEDERELIVGDLAGLDSRYLWLSRTALRERLLLSNADRERLKAYRIPPWDKTDAELAEQSRARRNANRRAKRRAAGAKSRPMYLLKSKAHTKPWESLGISRATYYRQGYHRETGVAPVHANTKQSRSKPQSHLRETSVVTAKKVLQGPYLSHSSVESQMKGNSHE